MECRDCGGEIEWLETAERKPDGTLKRLPFNINGTRHSCPQGRMRWQAQKNNKEDLLKWQWSLPVYCFTCMCYYMTAYPCTHLIECGFVAHREPNPPHTWTFPVKFHEKHKRDGQVTNLDEVL